MKNGEYRLPLTTLERAGLKINIPGWAGISIHRAADVELPPIEELKMEYRILSLSDCAISPQLWAHYANNYKGVCLCLKTDGLLSNAKKISYSDNRNKLMESPDSKWLTQ